MHRLIFLSCIILFSLLIILFANKLGNWVWLLFICQVVLAWFALKVDSRENQIACFTSIGEEIIPRLAECYGFIGYYIKDQTKVVTSRFAYLMESINLLDLQNQQKSSLLITNTIERVKAIQLENESQISEMHRLVESLPANYKVIIRPMFDDILDLKEQQRDLFLSLINDELAPFLNFSERSPEVKQKIEEIMEALQFQDRVEQYMTQCDKITMLLLTQLHTANESAQRGDKIRFDVSEIHQQIDDVNLKLRDFEENTNHSEIKFF